MQSYHANWKSLNGGWLTWSACPDSAAAPAESCPLLEYAGKQTPQACQYLSRQMRSRKKKINILAKTTQPGLSGLYVNMSLSVSAVLCLHEWKGYWWRSWRNSRIGNCLADRFCPPLLKTASRLAASRAAGAPPRGRVTGRPDCPWRLGAE